MHGRILLIEDDPAFRAMLSEALTARGFELAEAGSAEKGMEILGREVFDLILTDVRLPGMSGVEAVPRLRELGRGADILVMTAFAERDTAVEAVRRGAYDFFAKPFSLGEMEIVLRRAMERRRLQDEVLSLRRSLDPEGPAAQVIGQSVVMRSIVHLAGRIAGLDTTVLITGPSGTGKELMARTLHALSPRSAGPLVTINCAAIPENLLESELFGHEKGAFTGALAARPGKFEQAQGGTLFLDEIGDMPLSLQPKLLRAVEQKQVERLGGNRVREVDVRIVAATNQDLETQVAEKKFREDLYYRLNVASIHLPRLADRREDIPLLAAHFLQRANARLGVGLTGFAAEAMRELLAQDWPGNVRQLANVVERAAIVSEGSVVPAEAVRRALGRDLHLVPVQVEAGRTSLKDTLAQVERSLILDALKKAQGRQNEAARLLGLSPTNLWNKLKKHGIKAEAQGRGQDEPA
ncbi:MAG: sigma-54 dependent transcriptional regulator [Thermodesulfobacteriota bacterium]